MSNLIQSFLKKRKGIMTPFVLKLLFIMFFVEFVKGALLISILPIYMKNVLGLSTLLIGWTFAVQYLSDNLLRSPVGWFIDRFGYRFVMLSGVIITFASVGIISYFQQHYWIIAACALLGIGTSPLWPSVITGATEVAGEKSRGTVMGVIYMAWLSGVGMGPILTNMIMDASFRIAFQVIIVIMTGVVLVALLLPKGMGKQQVAAGSVHYTQSFLVRLKSYVREANASIIVSKSFYAALFAQTFALGLLIPVLTIYARGELNLTGAQYSLLMIVGGAITVSALIPIGRLVDRWGFKWFINIGFALSAIVLLGFTYVHNIPFVYGMVGLLGLGYALIIPSWNALIASTVPDDKRGAIWGFFLTIEGMGTVFGTITSGYLADMLGITSPFIASGCVLVGLLVLQIFIFAKPRAVLR